MKNSGRCSPWSFTKKYCTYMCHTPCFYCPPKVPHRPLSQTLLRIAQLYFVFLSSKKQTHTICNNHPNIVDLLYRGQTKVAFWFGSIARKGACTVISRSFACSVDIVAWPMQGRFALRRKFQKLFNDQGKITSNLGHSTSFHHNQKQQCKNCV